MDLTLKNIPEPVVKVIKREAKRNRRNLNDEVVHLLEDQAAEAERRLRLRRLRDEFDRLAASIGPLDDSAPLIRADRERHWRVAETFAIDCSVVAKWVLLEPDRDPSVRIYDQYVSGDIVLIAPDLLLTEFASLLSKRSRRKEITAPLAKQAFAAIADGRGRHTSIQLLA
jgi:hypothetical protein